MCHKYCAHAPQLESLCTTRKDSRDPRKILHATAETRSSQINIFFFFNEKQGNKGNSLAVQWQGLCALTAKGPALIPGQETKILQAMRCGGKKTPSK